MTRAPLLRRLGVSLVEVLVAVVVCGAGISVIATGVSASVRGEAYAGDMTRAVDHVELLLARLESGEIPLEELPAKGDFSEDGAEDLSWSVELDTTDVENLGMATIKVTWTTHGIERDITLERWLFTDPLSKGER